MPKTVRLIIMLDAVSWLLWRKLTCPKAMIWISLFLVASAAWSSLNSSDSDVISAARSGSRRDTTRRKHSTWWISWGPFTSSRPNGVTVESTFWNMDKSKGEYIDGLVQDCSNSIANALELLQSCTKPSICPFNWNLKASSFTWGRQRLSVFVLTLLAKQTNITHSLLSKISLSYIPLNVIDNWQITQSSETIVQMITFLFPRLPYPVITRSTKMPAFWDTPHHPMITHTSDSHQIPSQNKTKSKLQIKKIAKNSNFDILQETLHTTHLLKLLDKMYKYEMDPTRTVGGTERTRDAGRTDGRSETNIPPYNFIVQGVS